MKLIMDKILPQARSGAEDEESRRPTPIAISIVNQTSKVATTPISVVDLPASDYDEVNDEQ
jgi:hypothetical protein